RARALSPCTKVTRERCDRNFSLIFLSLEQTFGVWRSESTRYSLCARGNSSQYQDAWMLCVELRTSCDVELFPITRIDDRRQQTSPHEHRKACSGQCRHH